MASKYDKLRDGLIQSIEQVKSGALSPEKASAISKLASQVNASLEAELKCLIAAKLQPAAALLVTSAESGPRQIGSGVVASVAPGVTRHSIGD
jgi:hypothetical protein